jgi:hypothetical protein
MDEYLNFSIFGDGYGEGDGEGFGDGWGGSEDGNGMLRSGRAFDYAGRGYAVGYSYDFNENIRLKNNG